MRTLAVIALLVAGSALGAERPRYGGALKVAFVGKPVSTDPWLADPPAEAALLSPVTRTVCQPPYELSRPTATTWRVTGIEPKALQAAWKKVLEAPTPYRALLFPLKDDGTLAFAWPDLEKSLCHPALALSSQGAFTPSGTAGTFTATRDFGGGRAFVDQLQVSAGDARAAERLFSQHRAQLALGLPPVEGQQAPPLPFATYLAFSKSKLGPEFRAALESNVDRADLTRFFVRAPAVPLPGLIPGVSGKAAPPKPAPLSPAKEVTLLYDATLDDQRAVAERLQVRLHPAGYKVALKGLPRAELKARWKAGDSELMLASVLLPPAPAASLAVVLELAGQHDQLQKILPPLGAIADDAARAQASWQLAQSLQLELVPLYQQGLSVQAGREVQALDFDAYGLPRFDALFLGTE